MSKNQKSNKEQKKKPQLTPKEKRAAKRDKDSNSTFIISGMDNGKKQSGIRS